MFKDSHTPTTNNTTRTESLTTLLLNEGDDKTLLSLLSSDNVPYADKQRVIDRAIHDNRTAFLELFDVLILDLGEAGIWAYRDGEAQRTANDYEPNETQSVAWTAGITLRLNRDPKNGPTVINPPAQGHLYVYFAYEKLHNPDGPAVIHPDGKVEHWLHGKRINPPEDAS